MIQLMIVDDEEMIVDGLVQLFEDNEQWEVCRAYSPFEALDWLNRTKIDVVMTDIHMPGMNGLELQKEIKQRWPRCKVIFLTGFNDFHYVQEAIRNGAADFILKTEDDETILAAVDRAVCSLREQFEAEHLLERAKSQMQTALPLLQKEFLWDVLQGRDRVVGQPVEDLQLPLDLNRPVLLFLGRIDEWGDIAKPSDRLLLLYGVQNITEEYLADTVNLVSIMYDHSRLVWFVQLKEPVQEQRLHGSWELAIRFLNGTLESVQSTCKELLKLPVSFLAGDEPVAWNDCAEKFNLLRSLFTFDMGTKRELLLSEKSVSKHFHASAGVHETTLRFNFDKILKLETYLETGQKSEFAAYFSELVYQLSLISKHSEGLRLQIYFSMVSIYLSHLNRSGTLDNVRTQFDLGKLMKFDQHAGWEEAVAYLRQAAEVLFESKRQDISERDREVVRVIKRYVEEHLAGDLSLTRIGEIVGFNPSYLSRLYKQITGEPLSDYIKNTRVNKAKELLKQNPIKIHEIAEALGFESATYFARFFKKMTQITPTEYKEQSD